MTATQDSIQTQPQVETMHDEPLEHVIGQIAVAPQVTRLVRPVEKVRYLDAGKANAMASRDSADAYARAVLNSRKNKR